MESVPFDVVARMMLAARDAEKIEMALSFYRKGTVDFHEQRYLESMYDFYFMLESAFGEGKTKNYQVKKAFMESVALRECILSTLNDKGVEAELNREPRLRSTTGAIV